MKQFDYNFEVLPRKNTGCVYDNVKKETIIKCKFCGENIAMMFIKSGKLLPLTIYEAGGKYKAMAGDCHNCMEER